MIRLLVLCQYYPPENKIGAIRPSKLAKYLAKTKKYKITVVAAMPNDINCPEFEITPDGIEIFRLSAGWISSLLRRRRHRTNTSQSSGISYSPPQKGIKHFMVSVLFHIRLYAERLTLLNNAKRILRRNREAFDVVFSTYNTTFGHTIAKWYKNKHKNIKWIADFRDSVWLTTSTEKQIYKAKRFAKATANSCDIITAVSQGILETHLEDFIGTETKIVYNGYDSADIPTHTQINDGILRMTYTGELYSGQRDLTPVFKALYKLSGDGKIDLSRIQIVYAGKSGSTFEQQIKPYGRIPYINKGFIPRADALRLQLESHILLLSSWCHKGDKYTLTGKFFEYLGMNRPILCIISGKENGCILDEMISGNSLGFCYEESDDSIDFAQMCNYLENVYTSFINGGNIDFSPNKEFVESFEYRNIANKMDGIIAHLLNL